MLLKLQLTSYFKCKLKLSTLLYHLSISTELFMPIEFVIEVWMYCVANESYDRCCVLDSWLEFKKQKNDWFSNVECKEISLFFSSYNKCQSWGIILNFNLWTVVCFWCMLFFFSMYPFHRNRKKWEAIENKHCIWHSVSQF